MIEGARTWRLLRDLRRGARRSIADVRQMQGELLRDAVAHAHRHVPFYRRVWDAAGFDPHSVRCVEDLARLPVIDEHQVRAAIESGELLCCSSDAAGWPRFPTSGTSGKPLLVPRGPAEARLWRAAGLRILFEHGFRWRDATVHFDSAPPSPHPLQRLGLGQTTWLPHELPLDEQLERWLRARARFVVGTPTVLRRMCRALAERSAVAPSPRFVVCQGEILDSESRETIRGVLGTDPVSAYGMTEVGYIAWQCEMRGAFHLNADMVAVEILRQEATAAPGELGRVVVTDLRGRTVPLLRCDTGDLAVASAEPCPCGRTLPTLGSIEGRQRQAISTPHGRIVTARALMEHLVGTLSVDDYRLVWEDERRFRMEVTPAAGDSAEAAQAFCRLRALLGDVDVRIEVATWPKGAEKTYVIAPFSFEASCRPGTPERGGRRHAPSEP